MAVVAKAATTATTKATSLHSAGPRSDAAAPPRAARARRAKRAAYSRRLSFVLFRSKTVVKDVINSSADMKIDGWVETVIILGDEPMVHHQKFDEL